MSFLDKNGTTYLWGKIKNTFVTSVNDITPDGNGNVTLELTKGDTGQRGTGLLPTTTAPSAYTTEVNGLTPTYRIALSTVKTQAGVSEVLVGDTIRYSYYHYPIIYVDGSYAYCRARVSIRGASGAAGKTAYAFAQDGGYTGTEAEFAAKLAGEMQTFTMTGKDASGTTHTWTIFGQSS